MKRRFFTLLELLIALGLCALLFNTLFAWYRMAKKTEGKSATQERVLSERYAQQLLDHVLPYVEEPSFFFTSGESLVFVFDNGPHSEPLLSSHVLGRLYLDDQKNTLCLGIWPHPDQGVEEPHRALVLLENVSDLKFEFYFPPDPQKKEVDPEKVGNQFPCSGWQDTWRLSFDQFPSLVKIHLRHEGNPISFAFDLSLSSTHVLYKRASA